MTENPIFDSVPDEVKRQYSSAPGKVPSMPKFIYQEVYVQPEENSPYTDLGLLTDDKKVHVVFLCGITGAGKTHLSNTLKEALEERKITSMIIGETWAASSKNQKDKEGAALFDLYLRDPETMGPLFQSYVQVTYMTKILGRLSKIKTLPGETMYIIIERAPIEELFFSKGLLEAKVIPDHVYSMLAQQNMNLTPCLYTGITSILKEKKLPFDVLFLHLESPKWSECMDRVKMRGGKGIEIDALDLKRKTLERSYGESFEQSILSSSIASLFPSFSLKKVSVRFQTTKESSSDYWSTGALKEWTKKTLEKEALSFY